MAEYTQNYNLKKPEQDDFYNVEDFNDNADIIDEKLKEIEDGIENIDVPVTSVNEKTGDIVLTAEDVGAETPAGAQSKVDTHANINASTSKKGHVQLTDSVSSTSTTTAATPNSVKQAYDKANAALPKTGGTMTGILTAQSNTSYTVRQVRNIILSTADADVNAMQNGDIWIKYK
jgi:phage-related tail fiber protein